MHWARGGHAAKREDAALPYLRAPFLNSTLQKKKVSYASKLKVTSTSYQLEPYMLSLPPSIVGCTGRPHHGVRVREAPLERGEALRPHALQRRPDVRAHRGVRATHRQSRAADLDCQLTDYTRS